MLPAPAGPAGVLAGLYRRLAHAALLFCLLLTLTLTGCGGVGQPPRGVVLEALALQIQLTQGAIAQALTLETATAPELNRVRVEQQEVMTIGDTRGLRLAGRFDWRLPGDPIRVDSPFELFLQRGERGQSWRLAQPSGSGDGGLQDWIIHPLPLPGARQRG
jgi:murein DD-endopeptidase MepM/ murein hydrolase activator NlpD